MKWLAMLSLALTMAAAVESLTAGVCFAIFLLCIWNAYLWRKR